MQKITSLFLQYREIISYLIFGVLSMILNWLVFSLLVKGFGMDHGLSYTVANILSWVCAVLFAFVTNKLFVFESRTWSFRIAGREVISFLGARIFTGIIEWIGVPFFTTHGLGTPLFGVRGLWAKVIVTTVVVILNYIFSKYWIFIKQQ